jgi:hypothetical protein
MVLRKIILSFVSCAFLTTLNATGVDFIKKEEIYSKVENEMNGYKNSVGKRILNNLHKEFMKEDILKASKIDVFMKRKINNNSFKIKANDREYYLIDGDTYVLNNGKAKILNNKILTFLNHTNYKDKTYFKYEKVKHQLMVIKNQEIKYIKIPSNLNTLSFSKFKMALNSI